MSVESIKDEIRSRVEIVRRNPAQIGVLSTGEAIAVALLLNRLHMLKPQYQHPLDAVARLRGDPEWFEALMQVWSEFREEF